MSKIQITIAQIDNYGPWTVTPKPKREAELQILQAELYADLQRLFSLKGALAFFGRFDNMFVVSNGLTENDHREIQDEIWRKYPVTVSMGVGAESTAYKAQKIATEALQKFGSAKSNERKKVLALGNHIIDELESLVQIAHIDINGTTTYVDTKPLYDTYIIVNQVYQMLMQELLKREALVFYVGGDNFISPSNGVSEKEFEKIFNLIERETGTRLKVGIGQAKSADEAARLAAESLHLIRSGEAKNQIHTLKL